MNSFQVNKVFMAVLIAVFVVLSTNLLAGAIFHSEIPEEPGYVIEASAGGDDGDSKAAEAPKIEPIAGLLATADVAAGEKVAKKCASCHDFTKGGPNKVGPNLYNIVDAPLMHKSDFEYSKGMQEYAEGKTWTYKELNEFLYKPKDLIKGTKMGFAGIKKTQDRADLIAWMRTLSDNPAPLPSADAAAKDAPAEETQAEETPAAEAPKEEAEKEGAEAQ